MKIVLFLMNEKGFQVLTCLPLFDTEYDFEIVIGQDSAVQNDYSEQLTVYCEKHNLPFSYRNTFIISDYTKVDYAIAIGWRWLIDGLEGKLIVFHDSLLPRYRGFNPLVSALINGDAEVGVTAIIATNEFDAGNIIGQLPMSVEYPIKIQDAITSISECYIDLLKSILSKAYNKNLIEVAQDDSKASFSVWRDEDDYHINWNSTSDELVRFVDAVGYPYSGAYSLVEGEKCVILKVEKIPSFNVINRTAGKVMFMKNKCPIVLTSDGAVKITEAKDDKGKIFIFSKYRLRFA